MLRDPEASFVIDPITKGNPMRFQDIVVHTLTDLLNQTELTHKHLEKSGVKDFVKLMIRHYAEITPGYLTTWKKLDAYKRYFQVSERAALVLNNPNATIESLHFEHIVPVGVIHKKMIILKKSHEAYGSEITQDEVLGVLSDAEIIILTKEEATVLDGSLNKRYSLDGESVSGCGLRASGSKHERLNAIGVKLSDQYKHNCLDK
jgi:hypothetical protein